MFYSKLVETFPVVSECKTVLYFERCFTSLLSYSTAVLTVSFSSIAFLQEVADSTQAYNYWTETEQDHTRLSLIQQFE
jgi:hypothetical protein